MIFEELHRLVSWGDRHRRAAARLSIVFLLTLVIDAIGTVAIYLLEHGANGTEVHTWGQALFFTTVQLLTVSSQLKNPVTPWGRVVDVVLEIWAVIVVAGSAGVIASFFQSADAET